MTRAAPAPFTGNAKRDLGEGQAKRQLSSSSCLCLPMFLCLRSACLGLCPTPQLVPLAAVSATPAPTAYSLHDPMQPKPSTVQSFGSTSKRFVFKEDTVPRCDCLPERWCDKLAGAAV
eukprot:m.231832 g.231832  ORF g.231832 m.231832 type:complete len:118 (+) comp54280_c0_seq6:366-719(+)